MYEMEKLLNCIPCRVDLVQSSSSVLDSVLKSALFYRQAKASFYNAGNFSGAEKQAYLPWTASNVVRNCIAEQVNVMQATVRIQEHSFQLKVLFSVGLVEVQKDQVSTSSHIRYIAVKCGCGLMAWQKKSQLTF